MKRRPRTRGTTSAATLRARSTAALGSARRVLRDVRGICANAFRLVAHNAEATTPADKAIAQHEVPVLRDALDALEECERLGTELVAWARQARGAVTFLTADFRPEEDLEGPDGASSSS